MSVTYNSSDIEHVHITSDNTEIDVVQHPITINTGTDTYITIEKLFGPLCANSIRIHLDFDSVSWVIERERIVTTVHGSHDTLDKDGKRLYTTIDSTITSEWYEVARIDANVFDEVEVTDDVK